MSALLEGRLRVVALLGALLAATLALRGTLAIDQAVTGHPGSSYTTTAVYDPSSITGTAQGNQMRVGWANPGSPHNGSGFAVFAYHYGPATGACSTNPADYTFVKGVASTASSYQDTGPYGGGTAAYLASFTCYMVRTWVVPGLAPASWTGSTTPTWTGQLAPSPATQWVTPTAVQVGFVATSVAMTNGNRTMAAGDTLVITYDQPTNAPALSGLSLCADPSTQVIYVAQIPNGTSCAASGTSVGTLSGGFFWASQPGVFAISGAVWSNGNKTLTITVGGLTSGAAPRFMFGTWTFTPSQSAQPGQPLVRSALNPVPACNANGTAAEGIPPSNQVNVCLPTTTTTF